MAIYFSSIIGVLLAAGAFLFSEEITRIFVTETAVITLSMEILSYSALSFISVGFNILMPTYYTAINDPFHSILLTVYRTFIGPIIGLLILQLLFGDEGIWLTFLFMEGKAYILGVILLKYYPLGNKNKKWEVPV